MDAGQKENSWTTGFGLFFLLPIDIFRYIPFFDPQYIGKNQLGLLQSGSKRHQAASFSEQLAPWVSCLATLGKVQRCLIDFLSLGPY